VIEKDDKITQHTTSDDYYPADSDNFHHQGRVGEGVYKEWIGKDANWSIQGDSWGREGREEEEEEGEDGGRFREEEEGTDGVQHVCKGEDVGG